MHGEFCQLLAAFYAVVAIMCAAIGLNELPHDRQFMAGKTAMRLVLVVAVGAALWLPIVIHAAWQTMKQRWQGVRHA